MFWIVLYNVLWILNLKMQDTMLKHAAMSVVKSNKENIKMWAALEVAWK